MAFRGGPGERIRLGLRADQGACGPCRRVALRKPQTRNRAALGGSTGRAHSSAFGRCGKTPIPLGHPVHQETGGRLRNEAARREACVAVALALDRFRVEVGGNRKLIHDPAKSLVRAAGIEPARAYARRIFLPLRLSPPRQARSWSGLSLHRAPAMPAVRCCPSSLYTFPARGLARDRHFTGFPEFEQFCTLGFPRGTQHWLKSVASTNSATPA